MRSLIFILLIISLSMASCRQKGCTGMNALNYSEKAQKDDGSCTYCTIANDAILGVWSFDSTYTFNSSGTYTIQYPSINSNTIEYNSDHSGTIFCSYYVSNPNYNGGGSCDYSFNWIMCSNDILIRDSDEYDIINLNNSILILEHHDASGFLKRDFFSK